MRGGEIRLCHEGQEVLGLYSAGNRQPLSDTKSEALLGFCAAQYGSHMTTECLKCPSVTEELNF